MPNEKRVVVLIDMDCFYVQVEQRRNPQIRGKPCAVVQYNAWKGGGIIAVGYEARKMGVTRQMRGDDAKTKCPEINLCKVPTANGKADLTRYRDASAEVIKVLLKFGGLVERASIDEAYVDFTETVDQILASFNDSKKPPSTEDLQNTHVVGYPLNSHQNTEDYDLRFEGLTSYMNESERSSDSSDLRLLIAAKIVESMREAVYNETTFRCSAGVSHNKMLAKLACGINKPNKQTILPMQSVPNLFNSIKIGKIRNLGGKLGNQLASTFNITYIGELVKVANGALISQFGAKTGNWLYEVCRGIDNEKVKERHLAESVGCSKNFTGGNCLDTRTKVSYWMRQLATELVERLEKEKNANKRLAFGLTCSLGRANKRPSSRVCPLDCYDVDKITRDSLHVIEQLNENFNKNEDKWIPAITMMGLSSKNFKPIDSGITRKPGVMFKKTQAKITEESTNQKQKCGFLKNPTSESEHFALKRSSESIANSYKNNKRVKVEKTDEFQEGFNFQCEENNLMYNSINESKNFTSNFNFLSDIKIKKRSPTLIEENSTSVNRNDEAHKQEKIIKTENRTNNDYEHSLSRFLKPVSSDDISNYKQLSSKGSQKLCKIEQSLIIDRRNKNKNTIPKVQLDEKSYKDNENLKRQEKFLEKSFPTSSKQTFQSEARENQPTWQGHYSKNDNIDMQVFQSLPLSIQSELRSALGMNKEHSSNSIKKDSIKHFLKKNNEMKPSPSSKSSTTIKKHHRNTDNKSAIKFQQSTKSPNQIPFGFFRARFQASAAIRKAVEEQSKHS